MLLNHGDIKLDESMASERIPPPSTHTPHPTSLLTILIRINQRVIVKSWANLEVKCN